ncbi:MAG: LPS assembly lipoprotein LptE [Saprospiraceae bacterium]
MTYDPGHALELLLQSGNTFKHKHMRDKSILTLALLGLRKISLTSTRVSWFSRISQRIQHMARVSSVGVYVFLILLMSTFSSCYTLNGVSISEETQTYYVDQFDVTAISAPAEIGQQFSERLKQKINNNTRLAFSDTDPDIDFVGSIVGFSVTPESPNANNQADLNRLTIRVSVEYNDSKTEKNSYTNTFTDFEVFNQDENLLDIQDDLLEAIFERIAEDSFNKAFSNW